MAMLLFRNEFLPAIRSGAKRMTIRRWASPRVKAGGRAFSTGLGWLAIDAVDEIQIDDLTEADAVADGFDSLASLRKTLAEIYPDDADGKRWYRVRFTWEGEAGGVAIG